MRIFLILSISFLLFSCKKTETPEENTIQGLVEMTSIAQIDTQIQSGVSLIFFHASWCSVCQAQRPAISSVAMDEELSSAFFGEVEYEDHPDIIEQYTIEGFPTIVIYKDGVEMERFVGGGNTYESLKTSILAQL